MALKVTSKGLKKGTLVRFVGLDRRIWKVERTVVGVGKNKHNPYACQIITRLMPPGEATRRINDLRDVVKFIPKTRIKTRKEWFGEWWDGRLIKTRMDQVEYGLNHYNMAWRRRHAYEISCYKRFKKGETCV